VTRTDHVIVVGLGPVGATVALLLGRLGVPTVAFERETTVRSSPRAVALDDEALRVLQAAGLDEETLPELLATVPVQARSSAGRTLIELPPRRTELGHPALVFFHQPELERALRCELREQPSVEIRLGHEVEGFESTADEVVVTARDSSNGTRSRWRGRWLVACDGANSGIRRQAKIRLRGFTSRRRWLVVDAVLATATAPSPFAFICQPPRPTVSAPLPGGRHRWEFMLLPGEPPADLQREDVVRQLVKRHAGVEDFEIVRADVYRFHARVAERWVKDGVLLAGDAAHLSPPFAGQGLSAGLRDAQNLAWKLAAVVKQEASPALLQSYEAERRPHARRMILLALTLGQLIQTRRRTTTAARDLSLQLALAAPGVRAHVAAGGWKPPSRYRRGLVAGKRTNRVTGTQFPQPRVVLGGTRRRLDDLLQADFALVAWDLDPRQVLDRRSRAALDGLPARLVHAAPIPPSSGRCDADILVVGDDADATLARWFFRAQASLALIRPDRYVFAAFDAPQASSVIAELARALRLHDAESA
jgi:3-(3-hydroxy-phenyl)propionate hydroxylase